MITEKATIKNLFLIRNELEYQAVIKLAQTNCLSEYEILTIKDEYPYLVNDCASFEKVSTWQDWGVVDPGASRYWLVEYKEIEEIISCQMAQDNRYDYDVIQSQHFKFNLVQHLGRYYYDMIDSLNEFFEKYRPEVVYYRPENNFIGHLVTSFVRLYGI